MLTIEHNYISLSSTVGIQLHVSALYVGHLQVANKRFRARCTRMWVTLGIWGCVGGGEGTISRCSNSGYHDLGLLQMDYH